MMRQYEDDNEGSEIINRYIASGHLFLGPVVAGTRNCRIRPERRTGLSRAILDRLHKMMSAMPTLYASGMTSEIGAFRTWPELQDESVVRATTDISQGD
jgi:hypothetical protein